jgi:D-3-phosphoglycerate dehydrogenase
MRIVLCYPVEPRHIAQIRAVVPAADVIDAGQERVAAELPFADIFCGHPKVPVPWEAVVAGGRLRWVEVWETGKTSCRYPA